MESTKGRIITFGILASQYSLNGQQYSKDLDSIMTLHAWYQT